MMRMTVILVPISPTKVRLGQLRPVLQLAPLAGCSPTTRAPLSREVDMPVLTLDSSSTWNFPLHAGQRMNGTIR